MDYLITGASGFIGQKLVNRLLSAGNEVNYLGRRRSATLDSRAAFHRWDAGQLPPLDSVPTIDAVVHLMGEPISQRWNAEVKRRIRESRVDATRQLVTAVSKLRHQPAVLVSASAVGYYGDRGEEVLTESSAPGTDFLAQLCADWEQEALRARQLGIRVVLIRIATVLGREGGALKQMLPPFRFGLGGKFGTGRQWSPWIHVDDLVQLLVFAAETATVEGPLNGCAPDTVRNQDFTRALGVAVHRPAIFPIPRFALKLVLGDVADFVFKSQHVIPEATQKSGFTFIYPEIGPALRSLI